MSEFKVNSILFKLTFNYFKDFDLMNYFFKQNQTQEIKQKQLDEIAALEKEMIEARREQTKTITQLRTEFLKEKNEHKKDAESKIAKIVRVANKEARECLSENTLKIKYENQKLRGELLDLIQESKELKAHKERLDKQKAELIKEINYAEDLKKVRNTQQKILIDKMLKNNDY